MPCLTPGAPLLAQLLRAVPRRYAGPATTTLAHPASQQPASRLAYCIEQLHAARAGKQPPGADLAQTFTNALAALIHDALQNDGGDPAFQTLLLQTRSADVRTYLALRSQQAADRRHVRMTIDAIAHPAKPPRPVPVTARQALAGLYAATEAEQWKQVSDGVQHVSAQPGVQTDGALLGTLTTLSQDPALQRLRTLEQLLQTPVIAHYESLRARQGPRSGSAQAISQAQRAHQRGMAVEIRAAQALQALADHLDHAAGARQHRVITSLRVPAELAAQGDHAKTEWDAVLLRRASPPGDPADLGDIALIVEAKASIDAATTDLPRLLRGLRLLAQAQPGRAYAFPTQQGMVALRGASLHSLPTEAAHLHERVLYCSDGAADPQNLPGLNPASRMQLLSAAASLAYAGELLDGKTPPASSLTPLWQALQQESRWHTVLDMDRNRQCARALMVHPDDLLATLAQANRAT